MRAWLGVLVAALALTTTACVSIEYGAMPRTQNLSKLSVGISGPSDILAALDQPRGKGVARLAGLPKPRAIWYYEYTRSDGNRVELTILLVFLTDDRYDGHLWFSSAQLVQQEAW